MGIRLGVVGLRNIGRNHLKRAAAIKEVEVVACADSDPQRLAEAQAEFGFARAYADAAELFADPGVDAVVLALPNHLHAPLSIAALEAGKHVLVEKPIAGFLHEAEAMIEAKNRTGKVLMVGMNQRFSPAAYALRQKIRQGAFGHIYLAKTIWNRRRPVEGLWSRGAWGWSKEKAGGGPLLDLGIHKLDLLLFLLDFPAVVSVAGTCFSGIGREIAAARGIRYEVEDMGVGLIRLTDNRVIHLEASYFHNCPYEEVQAFELFGTRGAVLGDKASVLEQDVMVPLQIPPMEDAPRSCVEHFARVLLGREPLSSTPEQAYEGLRLIDAIYRSAESGTPVTLAEPQLA